MTHPLTTDRGNVDPPSYTRVLEARVKGLEQALSRAQAAEREQRLRADLLADTARAAWSRATIPRRRADE